MRQISKCFWESQPIEQPPASYPCFIRAGCFFPTREGELATFDTHMSHDRLSRLRLYTIYSSLTWELCCCYRKPYAVVCLGVWAWDEMCLFLSLCARVCLNVYMCTTWMLLPSETKRKHPKAWSWSCRLL